MLLDLLTMRHTVIWLVYFCCNTVMVWAETFQANLWFSGNCHSHFGPMRRCFPFSAGLIVVLCDDSSVAWMSAGNSQHLEKTTILALFGCWHVTYALDLTWIRWVALAEKMPPKKVTDSCFIAHFALLKTKPAFWATLNKFTKFASWSLSSLP